MIPGAADCQRGCAQFPRDSAHISMEPLAKLVANARPPLCGRKHDMHKTADPAMRHDAPVYATNTATKRLPKNNLRKDDPMRTGG